MNLTSHRILTAGCALTFACLAAAHVRLIFSGNGNELSWNNPESIGIAFNAIGSADVSDGTDLVALRNAVASWNQIGGTTARLIEDSSQATQQRTDFDEDDIHLILFDEDGSSGWFPSGTGTVAVTPLSFFVTGQIIDADILFNGRDFAFSTSGQGNRFDIQSVAAHELGHLVGLDHTGIVGGSLYPFVDPTVILGRSPSLDDIHGVRDIYPQGAFGRITGTVERGDSSRVAGAYLIAQDGAGRAVGAALADENGNFSIEALDPGSYTVWADPLDLPVSAANLTDGHSIETDFSSTELGSINVVGASTADLGNGVVGSDVAISLGRVNDNYPLRVIAGETVSLTVRGSGLAVGSSLTAADPTLSVVPTTFGGVFVQFQVSVPAGASFGHVDLLIANANGDQDLLPGALEITPPNPVVSNVSPAFGDSLGGTPVTLTGSNFRPGSRVVIGDRTYADGVPNGSVVQNSTTITLTLNETITGLHDVVVIDPTGVEGRATEGFAAQGVPVLASLFPTVGAANGGTELLLTGTNFASGATVSIDGVVQTEVNLMSPELIQVITQAGVPGGPYQMVVMNPDGASITSAFSYISNPDPMLEGVFPPSGTELGGERVTLVGTGFAPSTSVRFGADPQTGAGGVPAASVEFIDANTLTVVTPASSSSLDTVLVMDSATEQGDVDSGSFTFLGTTTTTISSGACHAVKPSEPLDEQDAISAFLWALALVGASLLHRRTS